MVSEDARWIGDAILSTTSSPDSASVVSLALFGHSSRIIYEGSKFIRNDRSFSELSGLVDLLPSEFDSVIQRARHATKILDDNRKSILTLSEEMEAWLELHRAEFLGNAKRFLRFLETDLGLFHIDGRIVVPTVPVQFRLGLALGQDVDGLGLAVCRLSVTHGENLGVLAAVAGDTSAIEGVQDYSPLGALRGSDHRSERYLRKRYEHEFPLAIKLLLLLVEGEITVAHILLNFTTNGHRESVFRARFISGFHALSAVAAILMAYPRVESLSTSRLRSILNSDFARWLLPGGGADRLRNQCMHYGIRGKDVRLDWGEPMFGLVPELTAGRTLDEVDSDLRDLVRQLSEIMTAWSPSDPR